MGVWEGWGGARDYCPFAMVVGIERLGATGGASPLPYKSGWDNADAKPTERSLIGKGGGAERWGSAW